MSKYGKKTIHDTYHHHTSECRVDAFGILPSSGSGLALSPSRIHAELFRLFASSVVVSFQDLHRRTQLCLTQEQQCMSARVVRVTVIGRLGRHVGEVETCLRLEETQWNTMGKERTLVKHVAVHWRFWGCDAKALAENPSKIGCSRTMPQQSPVTGNIGIAAFLKALKLTLTLNAEDVFHGVGDLMGLATSLEQVLVDLGKFLGEVVQRSHLLHTQAPESKVQRMYLFNAILLSLENVVGVFEITQALE